jgi:prophage regulatory protein
MSTKNRQREFLRITDIVGPRGMLPIGKSTWWAGVRSGRYPEPVKLGPGITAWRVEDIDALKKGLAKQ